MAKVSSAQPDAGATAPPIGAPGRIGLVVHPSRSVDQPLRLVREWSRQHGVEVVQVPAAYEQRQVAQHSEPGDTDLIVSIGGDGTTLAALRCGAMAGRPVIGIACGSLGALATVAVPDVVGSLDRYARGEWRPRPFPALAVARTKDEPLFALNDLAVVRAGGGQARFTAHVDGVLFARIAGDGAVVSTAIGSSGYAISAGGPLLADGVEAFVLTSLPKHGGFVPPLVIGAESELRLEPSPGFGGTRLEVDGQVVVGAAVDGDVGPLTIRLRPAVATMVSFEDQEPLLGGLRRRRIILDSPRMSADINRAPGDC